MSWYPKLPVEKFPYVVAYAPTEPLLVQTRKLIPPLGGVDVTPVVWFGLVSFLSCATPQPQPPAHALFCTSKNECSDSERKGRSKERRIRKRYRSKLSPLISDSREADELSLPSFREFCDYCMEPLKPGRRKVYGRSVTCLNADKLVSLRHLAELALKFFNGDKSTSLKLVKVYKINRPCPGYYWLTFTAQEDGVKECLIFRGVYEMRGTNEALFCEIKDDDDDDDDDEVTLRSDDDDYIGSERARESED